ncbi:MAG: hypothetical protein RSC51_03640 [Oscillospiraceae bacterium]
MSIGQQALASLTGNIEQARLIIDDYRQSAAANAAAATAALPAAGGSAVSGLLGKVGAGAGAGKLASFKNGVNKLAGAAAAVDKAAGAAANAVKAGAGAVAGAVPGAVPGASKGGSQQKTFLVHFNPSQLEIYATNLPERKPDATGKEPMVDNQTKAKLMLTTTLYFDEVNVYDSFMWEKFTAGATAQGAKNIAAGVMSAMGKKVWSVQDEVEGLVAALRNPYTRNVCFRWADFSFTGQLNNITAKYTMFSVSGRPVRAQVLMRIQHEMDPEFMQSWYTNFDKVFGGASSSLGSKVQGLGSLVNLNL